MVNYSVFKFRPGIAAQAVRAAIDVLEKADEPLEASLAVAGLLLQLHVDHSDHTMDDAITIMLAAVEMIRRGPPEDAEPLS